MILRTASFVAGVMLLQAQSTLPHPFWSLLLLPLPVIWRWQPSAAPFWIFASGFLWASLHAHWVLGPDLLPQLQGQDLMLEGVISSLPEVNGQRTRFVFRVEQLTLAGVAQSSPGKIRLSWYHRPPQLAPGERWRLHVRLKQPHGFMNPGGFDYEGWLYQQGIRATGYVVQGAKNELIADADWCFALQRLRLRIQHLVQAHAATHPAAGLLQALVIGERSGLSSSDWALFQSTGTNHLIAISGLHIGIVAGLAFLLGNQLWRRSQRLCLRLPAPQAAALIALSMATVYAGLAGFSLPTQRALVMLAAGLGALLTKRSIRPFHSLSIAMLALVAIDPRAPLSAGFWLSFVAVSVILLTISGRIGRPGRIRSWLGLQWLIALGLAPLLLVLQGALPLLSPLINLVAVPFFSLLVIPVTLLGTLFALIWLPLGVPLLDFSLWLLQAGLDLLHTLPAGLFQLDLPGDRPWYLWLTAAVGVILLLLPVAAPGRWLGLVFLLPLGMHTQDPPDFGSVWLDVLDVGQGLALVIRTQNHLLLYDAGPRFSQSFDAGAAVVVPFLRNQGVSRVDKMVLSNGDADHQGGAASLLAHFPVGEIFSGEPERIENSNTSICAAGTAWRWDGVLFRFLHPQAGEGWRGNNASCVLLVENAAGRILVTGDIESAAERRLLTLGGERLKSDLLLIPHHGSNSSSLPAFVAATKPRYALVATGYLNRYRFPKPEVVSRWQRHGAQVIDTAVSGAIRFRLDGTGQISGPLLHREQARRYWSHQPNPLREH